MKKPPEAGGSSRRARVLAVFLLVLVMLAAGGMVAAHGMLRAHIGTEDFRQLAESTVSRFLKAKVHIAQIRLDFLNQITLTGIEVESKEKGGAPFLFEVEEVVFRYHPFQFLTRNFSVPASVRLSSPSISWQKAEFPYDLFQSPEGMGKAVALSRVEMASGEARFSVPSLNTEIRLEDIRGTYEPREGGRVRLDFRALASGWVAGTVHVRGDVNTAERTHRLLLDLDSVRLGAEIPVPLENLVGRMRLENGDLFFDEIRGSLHGWETFLEGSLLHAAGDRPVLNCDGQMGKTHPLVAWSVKADFVTGELSGKIRMGGKRDTPFQGRIAREGKVFFIDSLTFGGRYQATGELDFESGDYGFDIEEGVQRISVSSNMERLDFRLNVNLNHVSLFGLDLVTAARIQLTPIPTTGWEERRWKFRGTFETDYFILEYTPFDDFRGSFELAPAGIRNLKGGWGRVFRMDGRVDFRDKPTGKYTVAVDDFDLKNVRTFATKPLPKELRGILEGRLRMEGPLAHPEVIGNFRIKGGLLGNLEFDHARIHFRGHPPYLPLSDSHIVKGRNTLALNGVLDMSLSNVFHGVRIESADKFILWEGWELSMDETQGDLEVERSKRGFPALAFKAGSQESVDTLPGEPETPSDEKSIAVGPKFKF